MPRRRQAKQKSELRRRVRGDGTVYYVDPKTGATVKSPGSAPASVKGLAAGAPRGQRAGAGTAAKKAASGRGASRGSVKNLMTKLTKTAYKHAVAAKKKAAANKRRGIKYIK